jgi:hypothetical protein
MNINLIQTALLVILLGAGCAQSAKTPNRLVLENSMHGEDLPKWVMQSKVGWIESDRQLFKASYTVQGNQRVNGCYDLAKIELKENLLSELSQDVKGEINLANEGIAENLSPLITKSIRTSIDGNIKGLKTEELVYERYVISDIERIDCYVKSSMSKSDYQQLKISVLKQMSSVSAEVAEALRRRQKDFFDQNSDLKTEFK